MSPSSPIRRIRSCREKKFALSSRRRARGIPNSDAHLSTTFALGWGTLYRPAAVVRLRRGPALFPALRARANGLQGDAAELETSATRRSDATRKMVGDLSGSAAQRARRKDQYLQPEPEGGAGAV